RLIVEDTNADADGRVDAPPRWLDIADQVEATIVDTRNKIFALDKLHAKHVLPGFKDRSNEEREIEACTNEITRVRRFAKNFIDSRTNSAMQDFRRCHSLIQRIPASASSHTFPPNIAPSQNDLTSTQNVQRALAAKVQELSALFRTKQRVYMQKLQGHAISRNDQMIASGVLSSNSTNTYDSVQQDEEASRSQLSAMQQSDPSLASRNREIAEIAKSIVSLAELFKDLSNLVIDQGTILDSVEYNIQQTAVHMQDAVKELDVATRYDMLASGSGTAAQFVAQLSAQHGPKKMHIPTTAYYFWIGPRAYIQATKAAVLGRHSTARIYAPFHPLMHY
ncbi:hypothetical protein FRC09_019669, partial [Ceratobasidium sp. 395]